MQQENVDKEKWFTRRGYRIFVLLCLVLAGFSFFPSSLDMHFSPDSLHYLDFAKSFSAGRGLTSRFLSDYRSQPTEIPRHLGLWPPLMPIMWGSLMRVGIGAEAAIIFINLASLLLATACIALVCHSICPEATPVAVLLAAVYQPFLGVASWAWTEPLFIALTSLSLLMALRTRERTRFGFMIGVFIGLSTLTRYVGVFTLAAVCLWLGLRYWLSQDFKAKKPIGQMLAISLGWLICVLPWFIRNHYLFGSFLGRPHGTRPGGLIGAVKAVCQGLQSFVEISWLGIFGFVITVIWIVWRTRKRRPITRLIAGPTGLLICLISLYMAGLCLLATQIHFDRISSRLLSPLGAAIIPLLALAMTELFTPQDLFRFKWIIMVIFALVIAVLSLPEPAYRLITHRPMGLARLKEQDPPMVRWMEKELGSSDIIIGHSIILPFEPFCDAYFFVLYTRPGDTQDEARITSFLEKYKGFFNRAFYFARRGESLPPCMADLPVIFSSEENSIYQINIKNFVRQSKESDDNMSRQ